ncbi:MAG: hypothetical protein AB1566_09700 [Chloroflexota bacterium]
MKDNFKLGTILAGIGALVGLLAFYLFVQIYNPMIKLELNAGRPDEAVVVRYVFPLLGYMAITADVLWMLVLYGFLLREKWAWMLGIIASTLSLLAGFFPMIPAMSRKATPVTAAIFVPSLILWVALLFVRKTDWKIGALAFVAGLAYVLSFMDGVATIDKIQISVGQDTLNGMYVMVQQINWWAAIAWAVFIFGLLGRKSWAQVVGLGAGLMACLGGYPLAVVSTLEAGRFSMFAPSPLLSSVLVVVLLLPVTRNLLTDWAEGQV